MAQQSINSVSYLTDTMTDRKNVATRRITIVMPDTLNGKIREIQAKRISQNLQSVSFSSIICQLVRKGLAA